MAVATLEDLQGSIEVVVFPKLYEQTGRDVGRGRRSCSSPDGSTIAARRSRCWPTSSRTGTRPLPAAPRRLPARSRPGIGVGRRGASRLRSGRGARSAERPRAREWERPRAGRRARRAVPVEIPYVSPLRAEFRRAEPPPGAPAPDQGPTPPARSAVASPVAVAAPFAPAEPIPTYAEPPGLERLAPDDDLEPALPDEARDRAAVAARAPTPPVDASPGAILHVTFAGAAGTDRIVGAMEAFKGLLGEHPGTTRVVLHVPAPSGGAALPMELRRGVAYDAELLAEVRRRLGEGIVELSLS